MHEKSQGAKVRLTLRTEQSSNEAGRKHGETGRLHRAKEGADYFPRVPGMGERMPQRGPQGRLGFPGEHRLAVPVRG